nr:MAG TPA: hypothetical protein [Caudoviricetes sp.]
MVGNCPYARASRLHQGVGAKHRFQTILYQP